MVNNPFLSHLTTARKQYTSYVVSSLQTLNWYTYNKQNGLHNQESLLRITYTDGTTRNGE